MDSKLPGSVDVGSFFDSLTDDYTKTIERCFPRYREMLWALLDYLPCESPTNVLELGCGTGNLSVLLKERFPNAKLRMVDISSESIESCRGRFKAGGASFQQDDFRDLDFEPESFDLVVSSISVHHLVAPEKQNLFGKVHRWLTPDGVFAMADQCAGATDGIYRRHIDHWKALSAAAGSTPEEWDMWVGHQKEHDHHDTLFDQISWLRNAGFDMVDCTWRYLLWAVVVCQK